MLRKEVVLIADDCNSVLEFTAFALEFMGYETVKAIDGQEAFEKAIELNPDLIILDYIMPKMDGLEATKLLRQHKTTKDTPIVMITGSDTNNNTLITQAMELGVNDFLRKPFERAELHARIKSLLKQSQYFKEIMELKNNELSNTAMQLAQSIDEKIMIAAHLQEVLAEIADNNHQNKITELISKIKVSEAVNPFDKLHKEFVGVNESFSENLLTAHQNLTPAEIKLCMLLRLNLSTKEIAALLYQTYDSVRVSRTRLREKLNLDTSEKLHAYLMQY